MFDDVVIDKDFLYEIVKVRLQFNGNEPGIFEGVGVVGCVYINPFLAWFWITKYRIYDPDGDGKTKSEYGSDFEDTCFFIIIQKQTERINCMISIIPSICVRFLQEGIEG